MAAMRKRESRSGKDLREGDGGEINWDSGLMIFPCKSRMESFDGAMDGVPVDGEDEDGCAMVVETRLCRGAMKGIASEKSGVAATGVEEVLTDDGSGEHASGLAMAAASRR
ncbi:hypothetical protein LR48_Vigan07g110800 [Vigna angularis]|uniref:Uncharacterized protein n=1 Tax=Phaseolus angularis TaxID=3914 RepID=A0A0L9UXY3_PHAAN|nr:hypothetical protein LR48_Vigan07g110800 [Vigna angularis]